MVITVFGASGKVGRLVVSEALARGYSVRAFIHRSNILTDHPLLDIMQGDIHDPSSVAQAISGSQAVISALGSWNTAQKDILTSGMQTILPIMKASGIERIVSLTGSAAHAPQEHISPARKLEHIFGSVVARRILIDGEEHIRLLRDSGVDWTVLRSPVMSASPRIFYKLSAKPPKIWETIPRKAVARAMVDQLDGASYTTAAPFLHQY